MDVIVYREFCSELATAWNALEPVSQHHVFQCHDWLAFWQETVGDHTLGIEPWIALVTDAEYQPRMLFPFGVRKSCGARVLEFLGGVQGDYQGPLIHDAWISDMPRIQTAWDLVRKAFPGHDVRHFLRLPAQWRTDDNPVLKIWKTGIKNNSYSLRLPGSFDECQSRLRPKFRSDSRRQRRRLSELGNLTFEVIDDGDKWAPALDAMIRQKRRRYRKLGVPDVFSDETVQCFYKDLPRHFARQGRIHFSVLRLDDEILATHWGAVHRGRFYFLMPTFEEGKWGAYSPGRLLLENLVEWSIQNGLTVFDFTVGGEDYKKDWCDSEMPVFEHLHVTTPLGLPYAAYIRCIRMARQNEKVWALVKALYGFLRYRSYGAQNN